LLKLQNVRLILTPYHFRLMFDGDAIEAIVMRGDCDLRDRFAVRDRLVDFDL